MSETAYADAAHISPLRKINLIFRFSYTIPFFLASVCGIVFAIPFGFPAYIGILIPAIVLILAILVNFSNDYFDHMSGIDLYVNQQRFETSKQNGLGSDLLNKIYWDGNQFDTKLVSESDGRKIMAVLTIIAILLAIPVMIYAGPVVLAFGAVGLFITYFYTAPPINLGSRGLGEISVAIAFFMMCFCSFFVATGKFDAEIFVFSVMIGLVVGLMRLGDSMSSQEAHVKFNERCLSLRLGMNRTIVLVKCIIVVAYILAAVMIYFNVLNALLFLTFPLTVKLWKMLDRTADHWDLLSAPMFFGFSFLTEVLFIIATVITMCTGHIVFW